MDTELTNSTANSTFPSILEDSRNAAIFFPVAILSATVGTVLSQWMRGYTQESQYSVLTDRIEAYSQLIVMAYNVSILAFMSVIFLNPSPGLAFCAAFTVTLRIAYFLVVVIFLFNILTRLLYLTLWRNVWATNEDFSMRFIKALTSMFALIYGLNLVFFQGYMGRPAFAVCSRTLPGESAPFWDPVDGLAKLMLFLGTVSMIILVKERKNLDWLHRETKPASGLPRIGTTHIGLHQYKTFIMANMVAFGFYVSNRLVMRYFANGLLFQFPYSASFFVSMQVTSFSASIIYPILRISRSKRMKQNFKRQAMDLLGLMA